MASESKGKLGPVTVDGNKVQPLAEAIYALIKNWPDNTTAMEVGHAMLLVMHQVGFEAGVDTAQEQFMGLTGGSGGN